MNSYLENTYWIALAHLPRWYTERINRLVIQILHENKMSLTEFFEMGRTDWKEIFGLNEKELSDVEQVKSDLPRLAFIAEQLENEGFHVIPVNSTEYSVVLKENLKVRKTPPVLYVKGRLSLLKEDAVAIVGSRSAGKAALDFTDHIAKKSVKEYKVVVSGFAKGVDQQALDSAIEANGKSIIVLPQGILTFQSGFKKYYEPIVNGDVMVLSTFFPKAGWEVGLAMARNVYIYGLAKEIYVAETEEKGGTWGGAMDGLRNKRTVYVRVPEKVEKNANLKLLRLGATPVNMDGEIVEVSTVIEGSVTAAEKIKEQGIDYKDSIRNIEEEILELLKKGSYTSKEIIMALKLDWTSRKLTTYLKNNPDVKLLPKTKPAKYTLADTKTISLFD